MRRGGGLSWGIIALLVAACVAGGGPSVTVSPPVPTVSPAVPTVSPAVPTLSPSEGGVGSGEASPGQVRTTSSGGGATLPATTPPPSLPALEVPELRYRLVDTFGRPLFCDPDEYPIARGDEATRAALFYPAIRADAATYRLIAAHLSIAPSRSPGPDVVLAVYRAWKMLAAVKVAPSGDAYVFDYIAAGAGEPAGWHVWGTIRRDGTIVLEGREAAGPPPCPICLARGTRIATPSGERAVETIRVGDLVWTADAAGGRRAVPVELTGSTPVPPNHQVVHLVTADGRSLFASPGHPLGDGRPVGSLAVGDPVDGSWVAAVGLVDDGGGSTFDLLPAGPTATYWADGILLGSTLAAPSPAPGVASGIPAGW